MRPSFLVSLLALTTLLGCGGAVEPVDDDAGTTDAGRRDGGTSRVDAGLDGGLDAGTRDSGVPDAGVADAGPNHAPVVSPAVLTSRTTAYAGQLVELALGVTDEDGDLLSFTWSGPGTFFENGNPSAQRWFSDERTAAGTATLTVSVTDNRSPPVQRQVTIDLTVPRFVDVFSNILVVPSLQGGQCVGCHGNMGSYQISTVRSTAYTQLVNAPHHRGQACTNAGLASLVVPGNAQSSLLYRKMTSTQPTGCGDGMPAMSQVVPASPPQFIVTVGSWIRAGAQNN